MMRLYSVIKVCENFAVLEFFGGQLWVSAQNFDQMPQETQLVKWQKGKFVVDEKATEYTKTSLKARLDNIAKNR